MTSVLAAIPTIGRSPYLGELVEALKIAQVPTAIYINADDRTRPGLHIPNVKDVAMVVGMPGKSIYQEWNDAAAWAAREDAYLLVLNDDIVMDPCLPAVLAATLDANEYLGLLGVALGEPACEFPGSLRMISHAAGNRYGFSAWCFMARPSMWQDVDERYQIWYGDDDLIWKVNKAGHGSVAVLESAGVRHHVSTTTHQVDWVMHAAHEDGILWSSTAH